MIDLHCHSLHSDGTDTPDGLALLGDESRLKALCLTDHDTLGGIPAFLAMQPRVTVRLLVGTELSITQSGIPDVIPLEMCYLGWQESLMQLAALVEPEIPG